MVKECQKEALRSNRSGEKKEKLKKGGGGERKKLKGEREEEIDRKLKGRENELRGLRTKKDRMSERGEARDESRKRKRIEKQRKKDQSNTDHFITFPKDKKAQLPEGLVVPPFFHSFFPLSISASSYPPSPTHRLLLLLFLLSSSIKVAVLSSVQSECERSGR